MDNAYNWPDASPSGALGYISPAVLGLCHEFGSKRVLDLGCGNGAMTAYLKTAGFDAEGFDENRQGIAIARETYPAIRFHHGSAYDEPPARGFDTVVCTEVIEHLLLPKMLPRFVRKVLAPSGRLILTTPYHGYLKNIAIAVSGRWDKHHDPLWDGGHVKFFSRATLTQLLVDEGFAVTRFFGVGRVPYLWKSLVIVAH